jgi:hypothetical protein
MPRYPFTIKIQNMSQHATTIICMQFIIFNNIKICFYIPDIYNIGLLTVNIEFI